MNEIVKDFVVETNEGLVQMDQDLVALEKDPTGRETLARVFRTIHTIKGTSGFLGFSKLEAMAHVGEGLLSRVRGGQLALTPEIINSLLLLVDTVRQMLADIEAKGDEGDTNPAALIQTLEDLQQRAVAAPHPPPDTTAPAAELPLGALGDSTIRVDVGLLDRLMNLVGELVLARNQIVQFTATQENAALAAASQRLNLITTDLQDGVMRTRLQPIRHVWSKLPRLVRELSLACGKQVRIEMEGADTELDKSIIEAIRDPLTHLVRNAIDHGIERPAERLAHGRPAEGRLFLRAFHEGGTVNIEIRDDGAGIDPQHIRQKAVEAEFVSAEHAARLSDQEALNLIFLPGFSTARQVTRLSGRGVGMDVVRTNIERISGTVDIHSRPGQGTTVKMKIPLTLAIIPALTVSSAGERYAIPQVNVLELVRLEGEQAARGIEQIHGAPVYRLRGKLLPLVHLDRELGTRQKSGEPETGGSAIMVVLQAGDRPFGLVVDGIHDTEEIVVKPLQKPLTGITLFAGATILGDGRVTLILDVPGLAERAHVTGGAHEGVVVEKAAATPALPDDRQALLLFATAHGGRMAIPLSMVTRLEEFPHSAVERLGRRAVVQYRNELLPLIHVGRVLAAADRQRRNGRPTHPNKPPRPRTSAADDKFHVVVYSARGRHVGLVVGRILDIVEDALPVRSRATRKESLFSAVIEGRGTEVLDVEAIIRLADPYFYEQIQAEGARV